MSQSIPRDKLLELINLTRQFTKINDNEINLIDHWCKMNHIIYNLNHIFDNHSINGVPQPKQISINIISMTPNVENFLNEIKATIPDDNIIYQSEFTTLIHDYIKVNNLYNSDAKTQFVPDDKLCKLFHLESNKDVIGIETLDQLIGDVLCESF
jgi:hypothetical protein